MALLGAGTADNPYQISTVNDLVDTIHYNGAGKYFKLMNDIALPSSDSRFPIPNFLGILDGNGKKLSSLFISKSTSVGIGLFSYIANATIKNLQIENFNVMGEARVGCLAGESYENCVIENVFTSGTNFAQTYAPSGSLSKWSYAGGLIGYANYPVTYRNVGLRKMVIKAYSYVGIFQGYGSNSTFEQCYSYPLAGNVYAKTGGYGAFTASQFTASAGTSYYLDSSSTGQGGTFITDAQLKNQSQLTQFDFSNRWVFDSSKNEGYPIPKSFVANAMKFAVNANSFSSLMDNSAWVNLVHPLIKVIQVGSHATPFTSEAFAEFVRVVRAEIKTASNMRNLDSYSRRKQLIKSIDTIVSHLNILTGQAIVHTNIKPTVLETLVQLLESGNDVDFLHYLINELYVKENSNDVSTLHNDNSTHQLQSKTEVRIMAYTGDTVRLKVNFKTYDGTAIEPTNVKLKIYLPTSQNSYELISTISLTSDSKTENVGEYLYDYTIPQDLENLETNILIYEFSGLFENSNTLARGKINIRFV